MRGVNRGVCDRKDRAGMRTAEDIMQMASAIYDHNGFTRVILSIRNPGIWPTSIMAWFLERSCSRCEQRHPISKTHSIVED